MNWIVNDRQSDIQKGDAQIIPLGATRDHLILVRRHDAAVLCPLVLTVLSNLVYPIFLKLTPGSVDPMISLAVTYVTAAGVCLLLLRFFPLQGGLAASVRQLNWASYALALAIVGLEVDFLLSYRLGWNISLAGVISNTAVAVLLVPVGLLLFREKVSLVNLLGIALCVLGILLINRK